MKALLTILILFLTTPSFAQQVIVVKKKAAGATAYCTGAATCTGTYPDQCDLLCEDMEGTASCASTFDSVCRNTWTALVGSGDAIDFTTNHSGTFACTDKGTNAVQLSISAAAWATNIKKDLGGEKAAVYFVFYFNLTSDSSANTNYNRLAYGLNAGLSDAYSVGYKNVSGTLRFQAVYRNNASTWVTLTGSTKALSVNTWYRVKLGYDTVGGGFSAEIADVSGANSETLSAANVGIDRLPRYVYWGTYSSATSSAFTVQMDNVSMDDDTLPGGCNL